MSPQAAGWFVTLTSASVPQPINVGRSYLDTTSERKLKLRGECIKQIKQLKELFDPGTISEEEYNEKKNVILSQVHWSYFKTIRDLKFCFFLIAAKTFVLFQILLFQWFCYVSCDTFTKNKATICAENLLAKKIIYCSPPPPPPIKRYQKHICVSNFSIIEYGQVFLKQEFLLMLTSARFLEPSSAVSDFVVWSITVFYNVPFHCKPN